MSCEALTVEELVAHLDGELPAADARRVAAHVDACAVCTREAELLGLAGALVADLPRHEPGADFAERVRTAAADAGTPPHGRVLTHHWLMRYWPAVAAAAVLVAAIAARTMLGRDDVTESVLTAAEEREIASDLYVLTNLDTLETVDADELIALVEELDLLEGLEPEMSGLFASADDTDGDGNDGEGG